MQITQSDFRTVHIRKDGQSFFLRYNLYQDGEERFPESINCREDTAAAYFLTSTIRDYIRETPWGFAVERSWKIVPEGQFALAFCLDLPETAPFTLLLPAVAASPGAELPGDGLSAAGHDTAFPNGAYLLGGARSVLLFAETPPAPLGPGNVSVRRALVEEEPMVRAEIRLPGLPATEQETSPLAGRTARPARKTTRPLAGHFAAGGDHEQALRFNVVAAPSGAVFRWGVEAALERVAHRTHPRRVPDRATAGALLEQAVQGCLDGHLVHRKGVHGLRTQPRDSQLSSAAGTAMANLLLEIFPGNEAMLETALRLADFSLKGQHPGGLIYGTYYLNAESWLSPGVGPDTPPQVRVGEAAQIACSLLQLGERLQGLGLPGGRYALAAERVAEALLGSTSDPAEVGVYLHPDSLLPVGGGKGGIDLIELFVRLHRRSGRDAHKKAVAALARRFFGEPPLPYAVAIGGPAVGADSAVPEAAADAGGGRGPGAHRADSPPRTDGLSLDAALREGSAAALLFESGYRPRGLEEYLSRLLPWVCVNARPLPETLSMTGAVVGGLGERRLLFRGWELAYTALRLAGCLAQPKEWRVLDALVPELIGFTLQKPIGTAWIATDPAAKAPVGPVDSRLLVREVEALLCLRRQFPAVLGPIVEAD